MLRFFRKELCQNPFTINGAPVPFECFPSNRGVIALDEVKDAQLIAGLDDAAAKRKGGIVAIDEAAYDELKKNKGGSKQSAAFKPVEKIRVMKTNLNPLKSQSPPASPVVNKPAVVTPPTTRATRETFVPATARVALSAETKSPS